MENCRHQSHSEINWPLLVTLEYLDNSNSVRSRKKSLNSRVHAYYKKKGDTKGRSKTYKNLELYSNKFWTIHDDTTAMYRNVIKIECDLVFVLFPYIPIFFSPKLLPVDILKRFLIENQNIQHSNLFVLKKPNNFMKKQKQHRQYLQGSWKQDSSQKKSLSIWITYTVTKMLIQEIQCCNWSFARLTFITGPLMTTSIAPFSSFVSVTSVVKLWGAE